MAKYIDADLLRKEIERRRLQNRYIDTDGYEQELFEIIDSLQQEQQEVDLDKEIINVCKANNWFEPEDSCEWEFAEAIALHFYELGKNSK